MKKKFLAVALTLAMAVGLTACGNNGNGTTVKVGDVKVSLGEYKGIALNGVTDEEVEKQVNDYVSSYFYEMNEIEGPLVSGDTAYINYLGKVDGVAFEGGTDESEAGYPLTIGSKRFVAGFEDALIGMVSGESKTINVTFPEDYGKENLNGKDATFDVTVKKILRKTTYELNDENVSKFLKFASVDDFKAQIKKDLDTQTFKDQIADHLMEKCEVKKLPEKEVEEYASQVYSYAYQEITQYATMYGVSDLEILKLMLNFDSLDDLRNYCKEGAEKNIAYQYIIKAIAKNENISVTDEIFNSKAEELIKTYGFDSVDALVETAGKDVVEDEVLLELVQDFLIENAKVF